MKSPSRQTSTASITKRVRDQRAQGTDAGFEISSSGRFRRSDRNNQYYFEVVSEDDQYAAIDLDFDSPRPARGGSDADRPVRTAATVAAQSQRAGSPVARRAELPRALPRHHAGAVRRSAGDRRQRARSAPGRAGTESRVTADCGERDPARHGRSARRRPCGRACGARGQFAATGRG